MVKKLEYFSFTSPPGNFTVYVYTPFPLPSVEFGEGVGLPVYTSKSGMDKKATGIDDLILNTDYVISYNGNINETSLFYNATGTAITILLYNSNNNLYSNKEYPKICLGDINLNNLKYSLYLGSTPIKSLYLEDVNVFKQLTP